MGLMLCLGGCSGDGFTRGKEIEYAPEEPARYKNAIEINGQWGSSAATGEDGQYGIGDPFVMRYNGKYYLYPSTSDPCDGIKVFESDDLVNWTYKGFAVAESEPTAHGAYAPETVYYNGWFYMCQSRAGQGHYIYRSDNPVSGFTLVSKSETGDESDINYGNLGMGIDGSFHVTDDGKLYLMHTSVPAGLKYNEITDTADIRPATIGKTQDLENANLHHWIEGPGIFRRGDYSYLTYTGNHVISKGYRVAYSYAPSSAEPFAFIQPKDNVTVIDTADEHYGLGHSSNVIGPDLDSVYTAYHSLVGRGPARRYNLDRYLMSGGLLTANGVTHRAVAVPSRPHAEARSGAELTPAANGFMLGKTEDYFTVEYNFTPREGQKLYFGKSESGGYSVRLTADGIALYNEADGKPIAQKKVSYPKDRLNTVRVENGDGTGYVYLNGMRVIEYKAAAMSGYAGYAQSGGVEYTAFSNDVFGSSDFEAFKNFPTKFPATAYLKGENRGFSIRNAKRVSGGIRVGEKQSIRKIESEDVFAVCLGKNDWVKYGVDVPQNGTYSIAARVSTSSGGAKLKINIGNSELVCTVPATATDSGETVKVSLGRIALAGGLQAMRVEALSGSAEFVSFETYENAGDNAAVDFADFTLFGNATAGETLTVNGGTPSGVALWGNAGVCDFEAEITFNCTADVSSDLGIMIRAEDYSYYASQPKQSWRGYYLKIGKQVLSLNRYDYGEALLAAQRIENGLSAGTHTLTVRAQSNNFRISLDGKEYIKVSDDCAFMSGQIGVYAGSGKMEIVRLNYKSI